MLLAHGVGTRSDLPVPVWLAAGGAGLAVLISFGALTLLWRKPLLGGDTAGWPIPRPVASVLDSAAVRGALRGAATLLTVAVCLIGFFGPTNVQRNLTPWAFYVTFWVGVVPASLLLGPVWRIVNPLRLVHATLARLLRLDPQQGVLTLPQRLGYWPAAASLAAFAFLELVVPGRSQPDVVARFILFYAVVHTTAAVVFGQRWFDRGDGFEVYSTLLGSLAPLGRRRDGRIVLRSPLDGLETIQPAPGLVAVMVTLVGSTAYDGLSRTSFWNTVIPSGPTTATLGLACSILLIAAVYLLGTWRVAIPGQRDAPTPTTFAHTIVPIAAGYAIAHYFSLLIFDGQQTLILASDPLGHGTDFFGTAHRIINYTLVSTTAIALVQILAIVTGHLLATVSVHDRAMRMLPAALATRTQYPLLAVMVTLTIGAVTLVFAP
ncbi:MAG TPA: hypothetical protein VGP04_15920 [Pseudonocardiaceae bacterium]|jgi:hypothetical protein|nr:hypothetical protein [Pseudonocardiaceae bacterium]